MSKESTTRTADTRDPQCPPWCETTRGVHDNERRDVDDCESYRHSRTVITARDEDVVSIDMMQSIRTGEALAPAVWLDLRPLGWGNSITQDQARQLHSALGMALDLITDPSKVRPDCLSWCSEHDPDSGKCVSASMDAGRVSVWLVAGPGQDARLAVDTPVGGGNLSMTEAGALADAVTHLVESAGGRR